MITEAAQQQQTIPANDRPGFWVWMPILVAPVACLAMRYASPRSPALPLEPWLAGGLACAALIYGVRLARYTERARDWAWRLAGYALGSLALVPIFRDPGWAKVSIAMASAFAGLLAGRLIRRAFIDRAAQILPRSIGDPADPSHNDTEWFEAIVVSLVLVVFALLVMLPAALALGEAGISRITLAGGLLLCSLFVGFVSGTAAAAEQIDGPVWQTISGWMLCGFAVGALLLLGESKPPPMPRLALFMALMQFSVGGPGAAASVLASRYFKDGRLGHVGWLAGYIAAFIALATQAIAMRLRMGP